MPELRQALAIFMKDRRFIFPEEWPDDAVLSVASHIIDAMCVNHYHGAFSVDANDPSEQLMLVVYHERG